MNKQICTVVLLAGLLAGCGKDRSADQAASASTAAPNVASSSAPVPYFALVADGWSLESASADGPAIDAGRPLGLKWNSAYRSQPAPNRDVGAALAVADPPQGGAQEFASALTNGQARGVTVGGHPAYAGEELSIDGDLIASHVTWDAGEYVVSLTVYETNLIPATTLAEHVTETSKQQWDDAARNANAR